MRTIRIWRGISFIITARVICTAALGRYRMQWKMRNGVAAPQDIVDAIDYGCRSAGVPRGVVCAVVEIESAFKLKAKNSKSKAAGLLQIMPGYLSDYQRYAGCKFDPYTIASAIAGGAIFDYLAEAGRSRGHKGNEAWQFAMAAHRYGAGSAEAKTPAGSPRVLEAEAMMRANGMWYDTPQDAPEVPVVIQLPMPLNPCWKQAKKFASKGSLASGFMIHSNSAQYLPAWHWPVQWNVKDTSKAVHFFADAHGIIQSLPDTVQGWHAGGSANKTHLGVELSEPYADTQESFTATLKNVRWLVETMQKKHGFSVADVIGHNEGYRRGIASNYGDPMNDPGYIFNSSKAPWRNPAMNGKGYFPRNFYSMDKLRADICADLGTCNPPPQPPPPDRPTLYLRTPNMRGDAVKLLQQRLKAKGISPGPVDGIFGPKTNAAVLKFQKREHLDVDGIVGPATWGELMS